MLISTAVAAVIALGIGVVEIGIHLRQQVPTGHTHTGDLAAYLLHAPAGTVPWATKPAIEVLDLDGAAQLGQNPTVRGKLLRQYGFQQLAIARWVTADGNIDAVQLMRFDSVLDARKFFVVDALSDSSSFWGPPTAFPGVPGAVSFTMSTPNATGQLATLDLATTGDLEIIVIVKRRPPVGPAEGQRLLTDQYGRL